MAIRHDSFSQQQNRKRSAQENVSDLGSKTWPCPGEMVTRHDTFFAMTMTMTQENVFYLGSKTWSCQEQATVSPRRTSQ